jgi:acetate kinase
MSNAIAVLNVGSSSIKFSVFLESGGELPRDLHGQMERIHAWPRLVAIDRAGRTRVDRKWASGENVGHDRALQHIFDHLRDALRPHRLLAVGHRVPHGGPALREPVMVGEGVLARIEQLVPLAPLHQPFAVRAVRAGLAAFPGVPQVACFDTSFHRTLLPVEQRFAIPSELHEAGVRRYGFHGLSYEFIASVLPDFDARAATGKTIALHLGSGASACALAGGRSMATTMGFTALDGLPMGTRSGALDPGIVLHLIEQRGMSAREVEKMLYERSGLLGLSGISADMRTLLASDDSRAKLAVDFHCHRIRREIGSLAAALGGLDALVFTGGIGENAHAIRERICRGAAWLGVEIDPSANARHGPRITTASSSVAGWVIPTDEERMIALHTRKLVASGGPST